jgi:hypothetical protein
LPFRRKRIILSKSQLPGAQAETEEIMLFGKKFLSRMDYKFGRYAIRNLMTVIVFGMAAVLIFSLFYPGVNIGSRLLFSRDALAQGELWRIISFIFVPPGSLSLFSVVTLYFFWHLGIALQSEWGAFKFNVFYFTGIIGTLLGGVIMGSASNLFLNLSLFLALAILYPNHEFHIFFLLPVKAKYLAYILAAFLVISLFNVSFPEKVSLIVSMLNIILFFGGDFTNTIKNAYRRAKWKRDAGTWFK